MKSVRIVAGKVIEALVTLAAVSVIVFLASRLTGSPEHVLLPPETTQADIQAFRERYGLDRPILEQYLRWAGEALGGDFGHSIHFNLPVSSLILARIGNSIPLALLAIAIAGALAVPLGVLAATHRGQATDRLATAFAVGGQSIPSFWLGMLLVLVFAVNLRLLPATGADSPAHFLLPGFTIGYFITAGTMRLVRSHMLETLDSEYVKFARSKGLPERLVIWKHALRNAVIPVVTYVGYMFGAIIAASITVEVVFNFPGIGRLVFEGILWRDFPVVQGVVLVWSAIMVFVNMSVDLLYVVLDPRVRA